jgi:hypothetical protein
MNKAKLLGTVALTVILGVSVATAQTTQRRDQTQTQQQQQQPNWPDPRATTSGQSSSKSQLNTTAPSSAQTNGQATTEQQPANSSAQQTTSQPNQQSTPSAQQPANSQSAQQPANTQSAQQPSNSQSAQQPTNTQSAQQPVSTPQQNAQTPAPSTATRNAQTQQAPQQQQARVDASGKIALNEQQRTRVSAAIRSAKIRPEHVNFSITVGTAVPRSVRLETLPASLVEVVPEYRGYRYFATEDRIVIVDPRSEDIVAFLPYEGGARAEAPTRSRSSKLTSEDREVIRRHARTLSHTRTTTTITTGQRVPDSVELQEFPETIYRDAPEIRHYRYYAPEGGGVTIVDPEQHTVVETIE